MKRRQLLSDTGNCNPPEIDATKLPARRLLKTSDLPGPKDAKLWEEVLKELPVDILLLTVEVSEFLSCVSHLRVIRDTFGVGMTTLERYTLG